MSLWFTGFALVSVLFMGPSIVSPVSTSGGESPACLERLPGSDAEDVGLALTARDEAVSAPLTDLDTDGFVLDSPRGARLIATDAFRLRNHCDTALDVRLVGHGPTSLPEGVRVEVWMADEAQPSGVPGTGDDGGWQRGPLVFDSVRGGAGTTGEITIAPDADRPVAVVVSADAAAESAPLEVSWSMRARRSTD